MSVEVHPSRAHIEPLGNLRPEGSWAPSEHEIQLSKAISLKRIADAIAPTEGTGAIDKLNEVLTDFSNNLSAVLRDARG